MKSETRKDELFDILYSKNLKLSKEMCCLLDVLFEDAKNKRISTLYYSVS